MPVIAARTEQWLDIKKYLDNGFWVVSTGLDLATIIDSKNENINLSKVLFFLDGSIKDEHTLSQLTIVIKSGIHDCMEKHSYGWCDEIENSYENLANLCKAPLLSASTMSTAVESAWQHIKQLL